MRFGRVVTWICAVAIAGCSEKDGDQPRLTVFVAASMGDVVESLARSFSAANGSEVAVSPAASGVLRKQIENGADCDVFISADAVDMDKLADRGMIRVDLRREVARNRLVVVTCSEQSTVQDVRDLADASVGRVAMGDPAYVPAGRYAQRALRAAGIWEDVEGRAVLADNVRVASEYVRGGQADVGLVYATDAAVMNDCRVLCEIDESLSGSIVCPGAVCAKSRNAEAAKEFLEYVAHADQRTAWARNGFAAPVSSGE